MNREKSHPGMRHSPLKPLGSAILQEAQGLQVLTSQQPGDSLISLGQAWVAAQLFNVELA
ncbi:MAG: hypothetical protein Q7U78_09405 [Gallionella sp.]|nr:hypothetical protein [Gallionella sp.]